MLDFKKPVLSDKAWVDHCLKHANSMNCEYTFGNVFCWAEPYSTQICRFKDFFICRWGSLPEVSYSVPLGEGDFTEAVNQIIENAKSLGVKPTIYGITEGYLVMLKEAFTGKFDYSFDDGFNDYIYLVSKMSDLSGKKYHAKRNHITNFKRNNPDWSFEKINRNNIPECLEMHEKWIQERGGEIEDYIEEFEAVKKAFEYYEELGIVGGLIRAQGRVIAYTMGEGQQNKRCFVTHFEKALSEIQGAYPTVNQEFTKNCLGDYVYVNREEDLGLEGLRKAKQSYNPEIMLKKCLAVYND